MQAVTWGIDASSVRRTVHAIQSIQQRTTPQVNGVITDAVTLCGLTLYSDVEPHDPDPELPLCRSCFLLVPEEEQWKARRRLLRRVPPDEGA